MEITNLKLSGEIDDLKEMINNILNRVYPVGSYYETSNVTFDPNGIFPGLWKKDTKGLVTVGAYEIGEEYNSSYENYYILEGSKEGENEHTLTINEMPAHTHMTTLPFEGLSGGINWAYRSSSEYVGGPSESTSAGSGDPHNNIQPSIGVYRWHRLS